MHRYINKHQERKIVSGDFETLFLTRLLMSIKERYLFLQFSLSLKIKVKNIVMFLLTSPSPSPSPSSPRLTHQLYQLRVNKEKSKCILPFFCVCLFLFFQLTLEKYHAKT